MVLLSLEYGISRTLKMATIKISVSGPLFTNTSIKSYIPALKAAADDIADEVIVVAREDYIRKKIANPKLPSLIFQSFYSSPPISKGNTVTKTVFAGAPSKPMDAYWAIYVDQGHRYPNGTIFEGHHFIDAGVEAGRNIAVDAVKNNLGRMR